MLRRSFHEALTASPLFAPFVLLYLLDALASAEEAELQQWIHDVAVTAAAVLPAYPVAAARAALKPLQGLLLQLCFIDNSGCSTHAPALAELWGLFMRRALQEDTAAEEALADAQEARTTAHHAAKAAEVEEEEAPATLEPVAAAPEAGTAAAAAGAAGDRTQQRQRAAEDGAKTASTAAGEAEREAQGEEKEEGKAGGAVDTDESRGRMKAPAGSSSWVREEAQPLLQELLSPLLDAAEPPGGPAAAAAQQFLLQSSAASPLGFRCCLQICVLPLLQQCVEQFAVVGRSVAEAAASSRGPAAARAGQAASGWTQGKPAGASQRGKGGEREFAIDIFGGMYVRPGRAPAADKERVAAAALRVAFSVRTVELFLAVCIAHHHLRDATACPTQEAALLLLRLLQVLQQLGFLLLESSKGVAVLPRLLRAIGQVAALPQQHPTLASYAVLQLGELLGVCCRNVRCSGCCFLRSGTTSASRSSKTARNCQGRNASGRRHSSSRECNESSLSTNRRRSCSPRSPHTEKSNNDRRSSAGSSTSGHDSNSGSFSGHRSLLCRSSARDSSSCVGDLDTDRRCSTGSTSSRSTVGPVSCHEEAFYAGKDAYAAVAPNEPAPRDREKRAQPASAWKQLFAAVQRQALLVEPSFASMWHQQIATAVRVHGLACVLRSDAVSPVLQVLRPLQQALLGNARFATCCVADFVCSCCCSPSSAGRPDGETAAVRQQETQQLQTQTRQQQQAQEKPTQEEEERLGLQQPQRCVEEEQEQRLRACSNRAIKARLQCSAPQAIRRLACGVTQLVRISVAAPTASVNSDRDLLAATGGSLSAAATPVGAAEEGLRATATAAAETHTAAAEAPVVPSDACTSGRETDVGEESTAGGRTPAAADSARIERKQRATEELSGPDAPASFPTSYLLPSQMEKKQQQPEKGGTAARDDVSNASFSPSAAPSDNLGGRSLHVEDSCSKLLRKEEQANPATPRLQQLLPSSATLDVALAVSTVLLAWSNTCYCQACSSADGCCCCCDCVIALDELYALVGRLLLQSAAEGAAAVAAAAAAAGVAPQVLRYHLLLLGQQQSTGSSDQKLADRFYETQQRQQMDSWQRKQLRHQEHPTQGVKTYLPAAVDEEVATAVAAAGVASATLCAAAECLEGALRIKAAFQAAKAHGLGWQSQRQLQVLQLPGETVPGRKRGQQQEKDALYVDLEPVGETEERRAFTSSKDTAFGLMLQRLLPRRQLLTALRDALILVFTCPPRSARDSSLLNQLTAASLSPAAASSIRAAGEATAGPTASPTTAGMSFTVKKQRQEGYRTSSAFSTEAAVAAAGGSATSPFFSLSVDVKYNCPMLSTVRGLLVQLLQALPAATAQQLAVDILRSGAGLHVGHYAARDDAAAETEANGSCRNATGRAAEAVATAAALAANASGEGPVAGTVRAGGSAAGAAAAAKGEEQRVAAVSEDRHEEEGGDASSPERAPLLRGSAAAAGLTCAEFIDRGDDVVFGEDARQSQLLLLALVPSVLWFTVSYPCPAAAETGAAVDPQAQRPPSLQDWCSSAVEPQQQQNSTGNRTFDSRSHEAGESSSRDEVLQQQQQPKNYSCSISGTVAVQAAGRRGSTSCISAQGSSSRSVGSEGSTWSSAELPLLLKDILLQCFQLLQGQQAGPSRAAARLVAAFPQPTREGERPSAPDLQSGGGNAQEAAAAASGPATVARGGEQQRESAAETENNEEGTSTECGKRGVLRQGESNILLSNVAAEPPRVQLPLRVVLDVVAALLLLTPGEDVVMWLLQECEAPGGELRKRRAPPQQQHWQQGRRQRPQEEKQTLKEQRRCSQQQVQQERQPELQETQVLQRQSDRKPVCAQQDSRWQQGGERDAEPLAARPGVATRRDSSGRVNEFPHREAKEREHPDFYAERFSGCCDAAAAEGALQLFLARVRGGTVLKALCMRGFYWEHQGCQEDVEQQRRHATAAAAPGEEGVLSPVFCEVLKKSLGSIFLQGVADRAVVREVGLGEEQRHGQNTEKKTSAGGRFALASSWDPCCCELGEGVVGTYAALTTILHLVDSPAKRLQQYVCGVDDAEEEAGQGNETRRLQSTTGSKAPSDTLEAGSGPSNSAVGTRVLSEEQVAPGTLRLLPCLPPEPVQRLRPWIYLTDGSGSTAATFCSAAPGANGAEAPTKTAASEAEVVSPTINLAAAPAAATPAVAIPAAAPSSAAVARADSAAVTATPETAATAAAHLPAAAAGDVATARAPAAGSTAAAAHKAATAKPDAEAIAEGTATRGIVKKAERRRSSNEARAESRALNRKETSRSESQTAAVAAEKAARYPEAAESLWMEPCSNRELDAASLGPQKDSTGSAARIHTSPSTQRQQPLQQRQVKATRWVGGASCWIFERHVPAKGLQAAARTILHAGRTTLRRLRMALAAAEAAGGSDRQGGTQGASVTSATSGGDVASRKWTDAAPAAASLHWLGEIEQQRILKSAVWPAAAGEDAKMFSCVRLLPQVVCLAAAAGSVCVEEALLFGVEDDDDLHCGFPAAKGNCSEEEKVAAAMLEQLQQHRSLQQPPRQHRGLLATVVLWAIYCFYDGASAVQHYFQHRRRRVAALPRAIRLFPVSAWLCHAATRVATAAGRVLPEGPLVNDRGNHRGNALAQTQVPVGLLSRSAADETARKLTDAEDSQGGSCRGTNKHMGAVAGGEGPAACLPEPQAAVFSTVTKNCTQLQQRPGRSRGRRGEISRNYGGNGHGLCATDGQGATTAEGAEKHCSETAEGDAEEVLGMSFLSVISAELLSAVEEAEHALLSFTVCLLLLAQQRREQLYSGASNDVAGGGTTIGSNGLLGSSTTFDGRSNLSNSSNGGISGKLCVGGAGGSGRNGSALLRGTGNSRTLQDEELQFLEQHREKILLFLVAVAQKKCQPDRKRGLLREDPGPLLRILALQAILNYANLPPNLFSKELRQEVRKDATV